MSWHKTQQYDPISAFLKNSRQQKLLDLKLVELEKIWYTQLKLLARDRLETMSELARLETEKRRLEHYDRKMGVRKLKTYTEGRLQEVRQYHKEKSHDNYNFDPLHIRHRHNSFSMPVNTEIPQLERQMSDILRRSNTALSGFNTGERRESTFKDTMLLSVSDSNVYLSSMAGAGENAKGAAEPGVPGSPAHMKKFASVGALPTASSSMLPMIPEKPVVKAEDHRYLKQRMATVVEGLPPVTESVQKRKMSV